jgi:hypothetical protein
VLNYYLNHTNYIRILNYIYFFKSLYNYSFISMKKICSLHKVEVKEKFNHTFNKISITCPGCKGVPEHIEDVPIDNNLNENSNPNSIQSTTKPDITGVKSLSYSNNPQISTFDDLKYVKCHLHQNAKLTLKINET